jgi:hypothetical protein
MVAGSILPPPPPVLLAELRLDKDRVKEDKACECEV